MAAQLPTACEVRRRQLHNLLRKHLPDRVPRDSLIHALEDVRNDYEKARAKAGKSKQRARPSRTFRRRVKQLQYIVRKFRKLLHDESATGRDVVTWLNISLAEVAEALAGKGAERVALRPLGSAMPASVSDVDDALSWIDTALARADALFPRRGRPAEEAKRHLMVMVDINLTHHLRLTDSRTLERLRNCVIRVLLPK